MLATEGSTERRLLQTIAENATWKCGVFCAIRNHESSRNEKQNSIFPLFSGSQTYAAAVFLNGR